MSDNFRQQIQEINLRYLTLCKCRDDYSPAMVEPELTEVVCAEVEKLAEGMPFKCEDCGIDDGGICDRHECLDSQLAMCQAFIRKELK